MYRKEGFDGIVSFGETDAKLSAFLLDERAKTGLTQSDFATLAGLARVVYSRYELNISRLTVSRMIHLSELLGFLPMQMIHAAAPHLYGKNPEEADDRVELFRLIHDLPHDTIRSLIGIVGQLTPIRTLRATIINSVSMNHFHCWAIRTPINCQAISIPLANIVGCAPGSQ
ncbi:helix-turn-helix domain-containing protein [Allorhizobium sp. NPDC080224]|uniref:helix-turn-helix domain-containing protein n=1 Tax=Allorhizobium TaxID=78526 RepID=UPI003D05C20E